MHTPARSRKIYRFGLFEAHPDSRELLRQGAPVKLQDQPFRLLLVLLDRPNELISREELRQQLWPADTFVQFEGSLTASLRKLRSALGDSAENPVFIETLPKRGYRFIAPVAVETSEEEPAADVSPLAAVVQPSHRVGWRRSAFLAALVALVILGSALAFRRIPLARSNALPQQAAPAVSPRTSIAVLGFNNVSARPEDAWVSTALSEMFSTELGQGDKLRVVPGEDVAHLRLFAPWPQTATLGHDTTSRIGLALNTDLLVLGSYATVGTPGHRQIRLDVRLQDAATGDLLKEVAQTGHEDDLFRLGSDLCSELRTRLGLPYKTMQDESEEIASLPRDREAARLYALGLTRLRQFDALAAKDLLEQAAKIDPKFSLTHAMLARAWSDLGYEQKRKAECKKALELSNGLPRAGRMLVEAEFHEAEGDHEKAASTYRALFELFPDNIEYGLSLAGALAASGHGTQAVEALAHLRALPSPEASDPRIDISEADIKKDKPGKLALLRTALEKASARGDNLVYASARKDECQVTLYSDHPEQGPAVCWDAYKTYVAAGNRVQAADCIRLIADREGTEGKFEQAIATYERALSTLNGLGEHEKTGAILNNMAINFENEGNWNKAERLFRQAKGHFQQSGDAQNVTTALVNIADVEYARGELKDAEADYREVLTLSAQRDPSSPGYPRYRLADLQLTMGNIQEAQQLVDQAIQDYKQEQGSYQYSSGAIIVAGDIAEAQGDLSGARKRFEEALNLRQRIGASDLVAETQSELAELSLQERHPEQAQSLLQSAIPEFEKEKSDPDAAGAYELLSHALRDQGKMAEARSAIMHGIALSTHADLATKMFTNLEDGELKAALQPSSHDGLKNLAEARRELSSVLATAQRLGYYRIEVEAQLAICKLDLQGSSTSSRRVLEELKQGAHKRGYELMSREAENLFRVSNVIGSSKEHL